MYIFMTAVISALQTFSEGKVLLFRFKFCGNDRVPSTHKLFFHYLELWEFEAK